MRVFKTITIALVTAGIVTLLPLSAPADEFIVYSVYRSIDLGNPNDPPQRDYYINMGSSQGLASGGTVEVVRRTPTYDLTSQKLYKDVAFPIARLKVIHVEANAAIARLDKMLPNEKTPAISPRAVMVGDLVRQARGN